MSQKPDSDAVAELRAQIDDDVLAEAEGVDGIDVDAVIAGVAEERADYGAGTQARFATAELERQIDAADGDTIKGILMGCRDRHGKNWPRRYSLIRSNGEHLEVSSWEGQLPGPDGHDVDLQPGSIAALGCDYNDEYDDWQAQRVESLTSLDDAELADKLTSVAKAPSDVSRGDEYEIVAVKGEIAFVNPQTVFRNGEPQDDGPVLMQDGREPPEMQPHFEVALSDDGGARVRGHLERQRYGEPFVDLPEIDMLLEDAADAGSPESQASFLQAALEGVEVVLVGNVNSVDTSRDDEGNQRTYVDVAATAIVAADADTSDSDGDGDGEKVETEPPADGADDADDDPEPKPESDDAPETLEEVEDVQHQIETAARLQGAVAEDLTLSDVQEMAPALADEYSDELLSHALDNLGDDSDDANDADSGADAPAEDMGPTDLLEATRSDGTVNCPEDGCLNQFGNAAQAVGHIDSEHNPDDPEAWIRERVEL